MLRTGKTKSPPTTVERVIKALDIHPKIKKQATEESSSSTGAFLTVFLFAVVLFLVWEESTLFFEPRLENVMFVDTNLNEAMKVSFDITFHRLVCSEVQVDAVDKNNEQMVGVAHEVIKTSVHKNGDPIAYKKQLQLGQAQGITYLPDDYCGSCYGAAEGFCCNTCEELRQVFREAGRSVSLTDSSPQCMRDKNVRAMPGEHGCRIKGVVEVSKIKGNVHVAAGVSHSTSHQGHSHHIHHVNVTELVHFNMSHTIHHLTFGDSFPGMEPPPLNGVTYIAPAVGQMKYFIQLVPTMYESLDGRTIYTNQFSVAEHFAESELNSGHFALPGVYFEYDFYAMRIKHSEQRKSVLQFLTRVCAVIGGIYVVLGLLYRMVDGLFEKLLPKRKRDAFD